MQHRTFGQTGLGVSAIGFGCWETGGYYGQIDDTEIVQTIHKALDLGINCFDTAQAYGMGKSEQLLARGLGERRKDIILVTKWAIGYNDTLSDRDSRAARAKRSIETSLQHLNTDYIDVYLAHWPDQRHHRDAKDRRHGRDQLHRRHPAQQRGSTQDAFQSTRFAHDRERRPDGSPLREPRCDGNGHRRALLHRRIGIRIAARWSRPLDPVHEEAAERTPFKPRKMPKLNAIDSSVRDW
ncbi:MAG: hypothetical protein CME19_25125 [Gemmatimonadetes bacterium]|nr:hypothetical protein [Gemmatimonadota bacterium]|tara:strand:+ start:65 stop:781 length:717 start_codon:yes stop_codon:yes gene_type:complete